MNFQMHSSSKVFHSQTSPKIQSFQKGAIREGQMFGQIQKVQDLGLLLLLQQFRIKPFGWQKTCLVCKGKKGKD